MNIVIAPNAFKNSLSAAEAAAAIHKGFTQSRLACVCTEFPIGDGGDGTASLIIQHMEGRLITKEVKDPLGRTIRASFGLIDNGATAVIEMADASGLRLLQPGEYNPMQETSYGTGELIKAALDEKVKKIILCIGGSATVDGGSGIMQAMGIRLKDIDDIELLDLPASLVRLHTIDLSEKDSRILDTELVILCDVENRLLGEQGAAAVFGPQKGASFHDMLMLEEGLAQLSKTVLDKTGRDMAMVKHGGAAGGVAAGLYALFNAQLVNGIDYFLTITQFERVLTDAGLVITGEGSIDRQTLQGKGPFGVAKKAKQLSLPVIGLAGKVPLQPDESLSSYFDILLPISHESMEITAALQHTRDNLTRTASLLGNLIALSNK